MHPGWKVFFQAFGAGFFTMLVMAHILVRTTMGLPLNWWHIAIIGGIAVILFWFGSTGAENLKEIEK